MNPTTRKQTLVDKSITKNTKHLFLQLLLKRISALEGYYHTTAMTLSLINQEIQICIMTGQIEKLRPTWL